MRRFFRNRWAVVLVVVVLLFLAQFSFFNPFRDRFRNALAVPARFFDGPVERIHNAFGVLFSINDLAKENIQLRDQLRQREAEIAQLNTIKSENDKLRIDLKFSQSHTDLNLLAADVISYSPTGLYQAIIINKGSKDGVKEDEAVVSSGYLIGKIKKISDTTSEIWLLNNRNLIIPVMLSKSQTVGVLKGSIRGLVVENIPLDTQLQVGDEVVSSSLEGVVPPGIAVGKIEEIISSKEDIFLTLRISSPININNLSSVFIVH